MIYTALNYLIHTLEVDTLSQIAELSGHPYLKDEILESVFVTLDSNDLIPELFKNVDEALDYIKCSDSRNCYYRVHKFIEGKLKEVNKVWNEP